MAEDLTDDQIGELKEAFQIFDKTRSGKMLIFLFRIPSSYLKTNFINRFKIIVLLLLNRKYYQERT